MLTPTFEEMETPKHMREQQAADAHRYTTLRDRIEEIAERLQGLSEDVEALKDSFQRPQKPGQGLTAHDVFGGLKMPMDACKTKIHWTEYDGHSPPPHGLPVLVQFKDGTIEYDSSTGFSWRHVGKRSDIARYTLIEP